MSVAGKMYVSELDVGLNALIEFIKMKKIGDQSTVRQLMTDKEYEFTVYTKLPKQPNQRQAELRTHKVKIPVGGTLYFLARTAKSKVDATDFIVNDGTGGWRINTYAKTVRRRDSNMHVQSAQHKAIFNTRINGKGFTRP